MSCTIKVFYAGLEKPVCLDIPEATRAHGVISFGSDPTVCFGAAPGAGGFVLEPGEAQEYGILPRHCALLWAGGKFRLEFDKRAGVYLNDSSVSAQEFCNPFKDGPIAKLRLGFPEDMGRGGPDPLAPWFEIERKDFAARRRSLIDWLANRFKTLRRLGYILTHRPRIVSACLAAVFAVVLGFFLTGAIAQVAKSLDQRITDALLRGAIPAELGQAVKPSVAAVVISCEYESTKEVKRRSAGTAWLYERPGDQDPNKDPTYWLVTNAHVAQVIDNYKCPKPSDADEELDPSLSAGVPKPVVTALFPAFDDSEGKHVDAVSFLIEPNFEKHPYFIAFRDHDFELPPTTYDQLPAANVYDLAALQITNKKAFEHRRFLKLDPTARQAQATCLGDSGQHPESCRLGQFIMPGRPLLVFGYPTEEQPFLGQGVSEDPFEFRTAVASRMNALSRTLPGPSTESLPALYSFSARSSGGMSGGPVIAADQSGKDAVIVGLVFSGTFVSAEPRKKEAPAKAPDAPESQSDPAATPPAGQDTDSSEPEVIRRSISDATYAVDIMSLDLLLRTMLNNTVKTIKPTEDQVLLWNNWANSRKSLDERAEAFKARTANMAVCPAQSERWKLTTALEAPAGVTPRGESERRYKLEYEPGEHILVTGRFVSAAGDEVIQMTVLRAGQKTPVRLHLGVNAVSFFPEFNEPLSADIVLAGPLGAEVELTVLTAVSKGQACRKGDPS